MDDTITRVVRGGEEVRQALRSHRLGWVGPRTSDFMPNASFLRPEVIVSCEGGADAQQMADRWGAHFLALEKLTPVRCPWNNTSLDLLADLIPGAEASHGDEAIAPLEMLAYCGSPRWETLARNSGGRLRLLAPPSRLKIGLDNKWYIRQQLARLGLPVVPSEQRSGGELQFGELARRYGLPFVVQKPVSSSGMGTFQVQSAQDLCWIVGATSPDRQWLISRYMGPTSININALALGRRVVVSIPSVQIVGVSPLTNNPFMYCGNDFGAIVDLPPSVLSKLLDETRRIGLWLSSLGFVGIFGVDFALSEGTPYPLEINPRFQGSTGLLGQLESASGLIPLGVLHCLRWLGYSIESDRTGPRDNETCSSKGAQAIFHWNKDRPTRLECSLQPGVYRVDWKGHLEFRRSGLGIADCLDREFLIFGLPPVPEAVVYPNAAVLRVMTPERLLNDDASGLNRWGQTVCSSIAETIDSWEQGAVQYRTETPSQIGDALSARRPRQ